MREFRYALRSLNRSPGFVVVATVCLGLALALNTTSYAIFDATLAPTLPVKDAQRLFSVRMWGYHSDGRRPTGWQKYEVLRSATFYEDITFSTGWNATVQAGDSVTERFVGQVSPNFFMTLGVKPEIGRVFRPGTPEAVAVISHAVWLRDLGGRPMDHAALWINGIEHAVVGVLHPGMNAFGAGVWIPLREGREPPWVAPIVRVKQGLAREALYGQLTALAARLTATYGEPDRIPFSFELEPLGARSFRLRQIDVALGVAALAVLLIACANLAGLMLARGVAKRRELAMRLALGSGRAALVRQLLTESTLVAVVGGLIGLVLSLWAINLLVYHMPPLGFQQPQLSWRVVAFSFLAAGSTILLFGLWPALRASDVDVSEPLKADSGTTTGRRQHRYNPLIIGEVALSLALLMAATLLAKATGRLAGFEFGYDARGLVRSFVNVGPGRAHPDSAARVIDGITQRVRSIPAVRSGSWIFTTVPAGWTLLSDVFDGTGGFLYTDRLHVVEEDFLRTLGIQVVQGRDFLRGDRAAGGAVIVDEAVARQLWPDGNAVGRLIKLGDSESDAPWVRVVGVARQASLGFQWDPDLAIRPDVYVVSNRYAPRRPYLVLRLSGRGAVTDLAIRSVIRDALPPGAWGGWIRPWLYDFHGRVRTLQFRVGVFAAFGVFATVLAAVGLYGVLSYAVSQRLREFGIRVALGAVRADLVRVFAHDAAVMVLAGIAIGAFLAMLGAQLVDGWLYNVPPTDAASLVVAEGVLLIAAVAACVVPALRASRANPVEVLRAI